MVYRKYTPVPSAPRLQEKLISYAQRGISEGRLARLIGAPVDNLHYWLHAGRGGAADLNPYDLARLSNKVDYDVRYYAFWRDTASSKLADETGRDYQSAWNITGQPGSEFHELYREAKESGFPKEAHGPFARFLEAIGLREEGANYDVGDTP